MITLRKSENRGHANHGWLNTYHTFSFANYYDPTHMGFRSLRVINQDRVHPGKGFPTHSHNDMEIVTYVLEGALEHKDSLGTGSIIRPGDVQRMSAGTGIAHSEYNHSQTEGVHFLQIWILPNKKGVKPTYEQKTYSDEEKRGNLRLIVSEDGRSNSVTIHQDVDTYTTLLDTGEQVIHQLKPNRHAWVQVARGSVMLNDNLLEAGDGAAVSNEESLKLVGKEMAEVLLFDMA
ncbi:pirin family protein [Funiculus sociatus GB2-A5]|uniref:Pirin family protein n=1 Tax=Funiculus sociatus GB2-A5 TaxID=2933946 RepID=A0ABV0JJ68_9CYAN|nr:MULTISPECIES: pirin family protein [unclassified Trichocoleus]MBD1908647.1 pirin family protein [Trichocoleus sp. FACHB-832]MBD2063269.1 pirin family protein [Trichocoleus sp. FACHB-6]